MCSKKPSTKGFFGVLTFTYKYDKIVIDRLVERTGPVTLPNPER